MIDSEAKQFEWRMDNGEILLFLSGLVASTDDARRLAMAIDIIFGTAIYSSSNRIDTPLGLMDAADSLAKHGKCLRYSRNDGAIEAQDVVLVVEDQLKAEFSPGVAICVAHRWRFWWRPAGGKGFGMAGTRNGAIKFARRAGRLDEIVPGWEPGAEGESVAAVNAIINREMPPLRFTPDLRFCLRAGIPTD